jgi:heme-degrading monooxygenase HmoA
VARYQVEPDRCDDAVRAFGEAATEIADMEGLEQGYICVNSEDGTVMTITVWRDQASLDASETRAVTLRQRAVREVDGELQSVHVFDVVHDFEG